MAQQVNSKMFKNTSTNKNGKKFKNPFTALIIIVILALASVAIQYIVIDINTEMARQIQEELDKETADGATESETATE